MVGRLLAVTGTVLVIAVALVTPVLATSMPASADMVVNGCTIVSNPTPTHFTNCANANLAGADLSSVNLSYANLGGAVFASCTIGTCSESLGADLSSANVSFADLAGAQFVDCSYPGNCTSASVRGANLTDANLSSATLAECVFFKTVACGAADFTDAVIDRVKRKLDVWSSL